MGRDPLPVAQLEVGDQVHPEGEGHGLRAADEVLEDLGVRAVLGGLYRVLGVLHRVRGVYTGD